MWKWVYSNPLKLLGFDALEEVGEKKEKKM
jgi:hypothetical protein